MSHPSDANLALYAGNELGLWARFGVARHLRACDRCSRVTEEFRALRDWTLAESDALPVGLNWNAVAVEMKANIRVGLAAGACVAGPPEFARRWRSPAFALPVLLVILAGWLLQTFPPPLPQRARAGAGPDDIVLEARAGGIGVQAEGRGFTLMNVRADNVVFTVRGQDAVRARYVDRDTGQVTISHVYAQ